MGKRIIFCADGTWNGPIDANAADADAKDEGRTNVYKLFANLKADHPADPLADEQERTLTGANGAVVMIAKYLHGVGDSKNPITKILGGTMGAGLVSRIVRGYTFISRHYQPGDQIILNGFSRGAYTARALAGLIVAKGLLAPDLCDENNKKAGYEAGIAVWSDYQAAKPVVSGEGGWWSRLTGHLVGFVADLKSWATKAPPDSQMVRDVPIEAVAVWDTVGAMGIPVFADHGTTRVDVFGFVDNVLSDKIANGFHGVAIDEQRVDFTPSLWEPADNVTQVLFPGAHSDVGGGYPIASPGTPAYRDECGLSDGALKWMMDNLSGLGVAFDAEGPFLATPLANGMAHQPWFDSVYKTAPRQFPSRLKLTVATTVIARQKAGPVGLDPRVQQGQPYAPMNI